MKKTTWIAGPLLVIGLLGTHRWCYSLGVAAEHDRLASFVEELEDGGEAAALLHRREALGILAKHPQAFTGNEVKHFCKRSLELADSVEKSGIAKCRQMGDDPRAERLQKQVNDVRQLAAQLQRGTR
jgi:hypothetical protein